MYTHSYSLNPDRCLHSAECTVSLLNQEGRNNYTYNPKFVGNTRNRTRDLWLDKCISNQQLYHLSYSATLLHYEVNAVPQLGRLSTSQFEKSEASIVLAGVRTRDL